MGNKWAGVVQQRLKSWFGQFTHELQIRVSGETTDDVIIFYYRTSNWTITLAGAPIDEEIAIFVIIR